MAASHPVEASMDHSPASFETHLATLADRQPRFERLP
jgi:hypothetical protein